MATKVVGGGRLEVVVKTETCRNWGACGLGEVVAYVEAIHSCPGRCCSGLVSAGAAARCACQFDLGIQVLVQGMMQDKVQLVDEQVLASFDSHLVDGLLLDPAVEAEAEPFCY